MPDENGTNGHLTPTQRRLLDVLGDGCPHGLRELFGCLANPPDGTHLELRTARSALEFHISNLRKKLPPGQVIDCVLVLHRVNYQIRRRLYAAE